MFLDGVFAVKADGAAGSPGPHTTGCFLSKDSASCAGLDIPEVSSKIHALFLRDFLAHYRSPNLRQPRACFEARERSEIRGPVLRPGPSISRGHLLCMAATHSTISSSDEIVFRPEDVGARAGLPFAVRLL